MLHQLYNTYISSAYAINVFLINYLSNEKLCRELKKQRQIEEIGLVSYLTAYSFT